MSLERHLDAVRMHGAATTRQPLGVINHDPGALWAEHQSDQARFVAALATTDTRSLGLHGLAV